MVAGEFVVCHISAAAEVRPGEVALWVVEAGEGMPQEVGSPEVVAVEHQRILIHIIDLMTHCRIFISLFKLHPSINVRRS